MQAKQIKENKLAIVGFYISLVAFLPSPIPLILLNLVFPAVNPFYIYGTLGFAGFILFSSIGLISIILGVVSVARSRNRWPASMGSIILGILVILGHLALLVYA